MRIIRIYEEGMMEFLTVVLRQGLWQHPAQSGI